MTHPYDSELREYRWPDASLDEISSTYDRTVLRFTEASGRKVDLICEGHISVRWEGHWDENVVERVTIDEKTEGVRHALSAVEERYGTSPEPGGGTRQISGRWVEVQVQLIDGVKISVVAQDISFGVDRI